MIRSIIGFVAPFLSGVIVCGNLPVLVGYNTEYEASWGKIFIALVLGICFYCYSKK